MNGSVGGWGLGPSELDAWHRAAMQGRAEDAISILEALLVEVPAFLPGIVQLSVWKLSLGSYREARELAMRAAAGVSAPDALALEVIRLLKVFQECQLVEELAKRLDWRDVAEPELLAGVAVELGSLGLYRPATEILDKAESLASGSPRVAQAKGIIQMTLGDTAGASRTLCGMDSLGPFQDAQARWMLSMQPRRPEEILDEANALRARLESPDITPETEALLAYALHNVLHASGWNEEASWAALDRGCRARLRQNSYDRQGQMSLFDALEEMKLRGVQGKGENGDGTNVVFVVGMHRSGTTLLERILAGHADVSDGGESYAFTAALRQASDHYCPGVLDIEIVRRAPDMDLSTLGEDFSRYASWKAAGKRWLTEKLPSNFLNLGFILAALPDARVLHMRRDPLDTCFSNLRTCFGPRTAPYSYDQLHLAEYYLRYQALMRHWHALWPGRIMDVDYHALVDNPEREARNVLEFCGLIFQPGVLDVARNSGSVATASLADVRLGIRKDRGGVWRRYERYLQPMVGALQPAYDLAG